MVSAFTTWNNAKTALLTANPLSSQAAVQSALSLAEQAYNNASAAVNSLR
jgi:hypothetical protein